MNAIVLTVETEDARALDQLVRPLEAVLIEDDDNTYIRVDLDTYEVLCYNGGARVVELAISCSGRGRVVGQRAILDD